jgi:uncharacterized membrane protein
MTLRIYPCVMLSLFLISGCATQRVVSFQNDIDPILNDKCLQCHEPPNGVGYVRTGLNMESYDTLMKGTIFGTVIIPGDSKRSVVNKLIEGRAGELMRMPHGDAKKLTAEEIELLKLWVNQGAQNN